MVIHGIATIETGTFRRRRSSESTDSVLPGLDVDQRRERKSIAGLAGGETAQLEFPGELDTTMPRAMFEA